MQSEQPLQGIKLQEKEDKNEKHMVKVTIKNPNTKSASYLTQFRS